MHTDATPPSLSTRASRGACAHRTCGLVWVCVRTYVLNRPCLHVRPLCVHVRAMLADMLCLWAGVCIYGWE